MLIPVDAEGSRLLTGVFQSGAFKALLRFLDPVKVIDLLLFHLPVVHPPLKQALVPLVQLQRNDEFVLLVDVVKGDSLQGSDDFVPDFGVDFLEDDALKKFLGPRGTF